MGLRTKLVEMKNIRKSILVCRTDLRELTQVLSCVSGSLVVPKSPRTPTLPGSMVHNVQHRFTKSLKSAVCGYCNHKFTILSGKTHVKIHLCIHEEIKLFAVPFLLVF